MRGLRYAKYPKYRYDSAAYLMKILKSRAWVREEFSRNKTYDWCDASPNSKIKHVDFNFYRTWQNKYKLYKAFNSLPFIPETYLLNNGRWVSDRPESGERIFFFKNPSKDSARETYVVEGIETMERRSLEKPDVCYVVQPAIGDLLLHENKKFDVRVWCALVTADSRAFRLRLFKTGYVKLCEKEYAAEAADKYVQMANVNSAGFDTNALRIPFDGRFDYYDELFPRIIDCIADVFEMSRRRLVNKTGNRMVWITAWDFLFNNDFEPNLIEINNNPAYFDYSVCNELYETVVEAIYEPLLLDSEIVEHDSFVDIGTI